MDTADATKLIAEKLGVNASTLFEKLASQKPEYADAIIFLQGDRLDRAQKVVDLYKSGFSDTVLITGNNDLIGRGKRNEENDLHLDELKKYLTDNGVSGDVLIVDDSSMNTKDQAVYTIRLAKEKGWKKIILVTSPFHVLRTHLTFLKQIQEQDWDGESVMQVADLSWDSIPSGREKTALDMLSIEIDKIVKYKDDLSPMETT
jgi:uncharacterized SAM-binding protein YcdF (DUF218 family)|tara:strand:- start:31015 stop:31623 length:609 start_codon:yes stop_codon:yes gene_type:complete